MFFFLFQGFGGKEYQTGAKRNETFGKVIFGKKAIQETWSARQGINEEATRQGARPPPSWAPRGFPGRLLSPIYMSIYPKNIGEQNRSGVPPPQASVDTENQTRPVPAPCQRGQSLSGGYLHHPDALHDEEGVVLPRG